MQKIAPDRSLCPLVIGRWQASFGAHRELGSVESFGNVANIFAMTTAEDRRPIRTNPKVLGTIGMIAAPMMLVEVLLARSIGLPGGKLGRMEGVLGLIYLVGFVCSTFGLRMLRVAGRDRVPPCFSVFRSSVSCWRPARTCYRSWAARIRTA